MMQSDVKVTNASPTVDQIIDLMIQNTTKNVWKKTLI